ncbi:MAG: sulfite oxidase heme-binding subunit YedZ [Longimicrobiales bacterium]
MTDSENSLRPQGAPAAQRAARPFVQRLKLIIWVGALTPAAILLWRALHDGLGANPIEKITHWTGRTSLTLLMITLAVTPLRRLTGYNPIIQTRRLIGLFAFFYAVLHFLTYVVLDLFFDFSMVAEDILKRPYITVGFTALVLLIPLAITSTKGWIRRMGRKWTVLHRLIYVSGALGVLHFYWKVKADTRLPLFYAGVYAVLMLARWRWSTAKTAKAATPARKKMGRPGDVPDLPKV